MSNSKQKLTMEFSIEDIPWLVHSLSIARNTAMMYGEEGNKVKERIKGHLEFVKQHFPVISNYDIEEYKFFNAVSKLYVCKRWSVYQEKPYWWDRQDDPLWKDSVYYEKIYICIDDSFYPVTRSIEYKPELIEKLTEFLQQIVPIESKYYVCEEGPEKKRYY